MGFLVINDMRTTGIILLINLFSLCSIFKCSEADHTSNVESDVVSETANEEDGMATHQPDTILIEFDGGINILWDNVNDTIIKDENYYSLSQEPININIVNAISDTSIVSNHVCSKHSPLRKGDVAFLTLCKLQHIYPAKDLHYQFDVFDKDCEYPYGMLDYLEDNRELIKEAILKEKFNKDKPHN